MHQVQVDYVLASALQIDPSNARTHSDKQVAQIARSIEKFGFNNPILVDGDRKVVAGHGRLRAAEKLGITNVPIISLDHLSPAQRRAYALADNRIAEMAGWDRSLLAIELNYLLEIDIDFEITDTGFDMPEIDLLVGNLLSDDGCVGSGEEQSIPDDAPAVARAGDLWKLGDHLVFCGDALDPKCYSTLLSDERANLVFTDPPYNVPINGHVSGLGKTRHREFLQASGEMSAEQFSQFLQRACECMCDASQDGAIQFICMDWRHIHDLIPAGLKVYSELKNICVWVKPNGGMGTLYRSRHELVAVFKAGKKAHINNVQLGSYGRYRTNVWEYDGMSSFQANREAALAMHPTVKPIGMIADAILDCSVRGDIVLDPFAGSGSTVIAAERTGRRCCAIELDPRYVDVIIARFVGVTGKPATNLWTGQVITSEQRTKGKC